MEYDDNFMLTEDSTPLVIAENEPDALAAKMLPCVLNTAALMLRSSAWLVDGLETPAIFKEINSMAGNVYALDSVTVTTCNSLIVAFAANSWLVGD
jgi:hypothetical protein